MKEALFILRYNILIFWFLLIMISILVDSNNKELTLKYNCWISGSNCGIDSDIDIVRGSWPWHRPMTLCGCHALMHGWHYASLLLSNPYFAITLISFVTHVDRSLDHIQYSNAALSSVTQMFTVRQSFAIVKSPGYKCNQTLISVCDIHLFTAQISNDPLNRKGHYRSAKDQ